MSKMSKATLETKLEEAKIFNKLLLEENKKLKEKLKELEIKNTKNKCIGRKPFNDEEVIKEMFNLYLDGLSLQQIVNQFNSAAILTARGKKWSKSSISWIMHKEINENIVGKETYNKVINQMKNNKPKLKK